MLAQVVRGSLIESIHHALAVVTAPDGSIAAAWGPPETVVLPRSALKPIQAVAMLEAGATLAPPHLAVACASHSGEAAHLVEVRGLLRRSGLDKSALDNTPDWPLDEMAREAAIASGAARSALMQNCSGKHAAMLTACVVNRWPIVGYRDFDHPVQQAVTTTMAATGVPALETVIDGCGAPAHAVHFDRLAHAFGRLAAASSGPFQQTADAMRHHPHLVGGTKREPTDLMSLLPGAIAKDGAEGVFAVGLRDGRGIAIKVADGSNRARCVILGAVLATLGVGGPEVRARLGHQPVLGHGEPVGSVVAVGI